MNPESSGWRRFFHILLPGWCAIGAVRLWLVLLQHDVVILAAVDDGLDDDGALRVEGLGQLLSKLDWIVGGAYGDPKDIVPPDRPLFTDGRAVNRIALLFLLDP